MQPDMKPEIRRELSEQDRRDVDYAKRQFEKGAPRAEIIRQIADYRSKDKDNPSEHALYIVRRASFEMKTDQDLRYAERQMEKGLGREELIQRIAAYRQDFPDPRSHAEITVARAERNLAWLRELDLDRQRIGDQLRDGVGRESVRAMLLESRMDFPEAEKYSAWAVARVSQDLRHDGDLLRLRVVTPDNAATVRTADYIRDNFQPDDRLAVLYIRKDDVGTDHVRQEIVTSREMSSPDYLERMRWMNDKGNNVYVSMNTLNEGATGRKADDIKEIRHIYLDIDHNGREGLAAVLKDSDLPKPSYLLNTSPEKYQVVWRVEGFSKAEAEKLNDLLVRRYHADDKVKDIARVLRVPDLDNRKYEIPFRVQAVRLSEGVFTRNDFKVQETMIRTNSPAVDRSKGSPDLGTPVKSQVTELASPPVSQSEKDWAFARRALARGDDPVDVKNRIMAHRQGEKRDLLDYVNRTVDKAFAVNALQRGLPEEQIQEVIRRHQVGPERHDFLDRYIENTMRQAREYAGRHEAPGEIAPTDFKVNPDVRMTDFSRESNDKTLQPSRGPEMSR